MEKKTPQQESAHIEQIKWQKQVIKEELYEAEKLLPNAKNPRF